jgi:hypothetical protein
MDPTASSGSVATSSPLGEPRGSPGVTLSTSNVMNSESGSSTTSITYQKLLTFRTITTLISVLDKYQSSRMQITDSSDILEGQDSVRALNAFARLLVREHEIAAVVTGTHSSYGSPLVELTITYNHDNYTESTSDYVMTVNPRTNPPPQGQTLKALGRSDSLTYQGSSPSLIRPVAPQQELLRVDPIHYVTTRW